MRLAGRLWLGIALGMGMAAGAQGVPERTVGEALRSLAARSGTVVVGQVQRIEPKAGVVEIEFRVDQTLLGAAGATLVLREWAGLWPPGQHPFVLGQRCLVFLHAASAAGLSSPVDGMEGVVPVLPQGAGDALLDVRRLQARLLRPEGVALPGAGEGGITLAEASLVVRTWNRVLWREPGKRPLPVARAGLNVAPGQVLLLDKRTAGPMHVAP